MSSSKEIEYRQAVALALYLIVRVLNALLNLIVIMAITEGKAAYLERSEYHKAAAAYNGLYDLVERQIIPLAGTNKVIVSRQADQAERI